MEISIIVPVFNVEKYLPKCLDSLCAQDKCVKEIILIIDGSIDNSLSICKEYADKDSRIKILCQENSGTMSAILAGVNASKCEYIGFVDSDDFISADMYRKMSDTMQRTNAEIVVCDYYRVYPDGRKEYQNGLPVCDSCEIYERENEAWDMQLLPTLQKYDSVSPFRWNKLFKKNVLKNSHGFFDNHIRIGEDIALVIPVLFEVKRIAYIREGLYFYEQRANSLVHTYNTACFYGWKKLINVLSESAKKCHYEFTTSFNDISLAILLSVCLYKIHISNLSTKEKASEYRAIREDADVRVLLCTTKIRTNRKHKLVFWMLRHKMYSLLAKIY